VKVSDIESGVADFCPMMLSKREELPPSKLLCIGPKCAVFKYSTRGGRDCPEYIDTDYGVCGLIK
jgi:hypothetical protein